MNKKIIITALSSVVLASAVYAMPIKGEMDNKDSGCKYNKKDMKKQGMQKHHGMKKHHKMMKRDSSRGLMGAFAKLDLSDKQQEDIKSIFKTAFDNKKKMNSAFSKTSFNKEAYIKEAMNKKENMIKLRANTIEKAYNVLNKKQKEQFKVLVDLNI